MTLNKVKNTWDKLGKLDPLWAVLSWSEKKGNKWSEAEFFKHGEKEIKEVVEYIKKINEDLLYCKALDFGCGVGRLSQPLCKYFEKVIGVDIAPSMIKLANEYNNYDQKCQYFLNQENNLKIFGENSFDLVYTNITLQHMKPEYSKNYIKEFNRIIKPGGLVIFQLPSEIKKTKSLTKKIKQTLKNLAPNFIIKIYKKMKYGSELTYEMNGIERVEMEYFLNEIGAKIVDVVENNCAGPDWVSYRYCVSK